MTAEVAILNRIGVALAADSAASIGEDADKIYNTNKLFGLSGSCPVGVMIYDCADHLLTPLETVIKLFREHCKDSPEPTIRHYVDKFVAFLAEKQFLNEITDKHHVKNVAISLLSDIREDVDEIAVEIVSRTGKFPKRSIDSMLSEVVGRTLSLWQGAETIKALADVSPNDIAEHYKKDIDDAIKYIFPELKIESALRARIIRVVSLFLLRGQSEISSGIVIAGFGEEENFPHLIHVVVDGAVCGHLKYWEVKDSAIDPVSNTAVIFPFAQHEMVERFIEGVDGNYLKWIEETSRTMFTRFGEELIKSAVRPRSRKNSFLKQLPKIVDKTIAGLSDSSGKFRRRKFINPVLDIVDFLPKEELANMAEALVSLTSTKRRVSREKETVGGPVDVAVISKGDGFIWMKRKQYFRSDLNPQFVARYKAPKE